MRAPIVHLELHTGDLPGARELCAGLCGWRTEWVGAPGGGPYLALDVGHGLGGGIVACDAPRSLWLPYVEVPSVDRATERARALGASVLLEPRTGPTGSRSVVSTAAGAQLAFWRPR